MVNAKVTVTKDNTKQLLNLLQDIKDLEVYVGIPEAESSRKGDGEVTNAELCYIHTNGSPINGIPARPIIEPAIELPENKESITAELGLASKAVLNQKPIEARQHLEKAGMIGQNAARAWFTDPRNNWPENSITTAKNKLSKMSEKDLGELIGVKYASLQEVISAGVDITAKEISRPLIDTGELRKSIIYVVK